MMEIHRRYMYSYIPRREVDNGCSAVLTLVSEGRRRCRRPKTTWRRTVERERERERERVRWSEDV